MELKAGQWVVVKDGSYAISITREGTAKPDSLAFDGSRRFKIVAFASNLPTERCYGIPHTVTNNVILFEPATGKTCFSYKKFIAPAPCAAIRKNKTITLSPELCEALRQQLI